MIEVRLYCDASGRQVCAAAELDASKGDRQRLVFGLPPDVGSAHLRLVLGIESGFFHIFKIAMRCEPDTGPEKLLWCAETSAEIAQVAQPKNVRLCRSAVGEVFVPTGGGAEFELRLPPVDHPNGSLYLDVEMDWPKSADFIVARDTFLGEAERLRERVAAQAERIAELEAAAAELQLIKQSKVWRFAEALRRLFYLKLLGGVPVLQRLLLTATRAHAGLDAETPRPRIRRRGRRARTQRDEDYEKFLARHALRESDRDRIRKEIAGFESSPKISVIMPVYNTAPEWLAAAVASVQAQLYTNWELCIVDDASTRSATVEFLKAIRHPRIRVRFNKRNKNIAGATNDAIALASGEYLAFLDHDDELTEDALYEVVKAINAERPDLIYSDEDFIDRDGELCNPHFKPDFSPDLLLSHNYITHLLVVRRGLLDVIGLLDSEHDGAQDYDLVLRATEATNRIHHIPKVLYHWRMTEQSTSFDAKAKPGALIAARRALEKALARRGIEGQVLNANIPHFFRVKRRLTGDKPLVSIVIPFRDRPDLLRTCIDSILANSTYERYEIVGVSNNSALSETFAVMEAYEKRDRRVRFHEYNIEFNYSRLVNHGVHLAKGEHVVLLNNDIELITWDWIEAMLEHSQRPEVGAVGGKLYYPGNVVQHAGIIVGIGGCGGHAHKRLPSNHTGYFNRLNLIQNVSAVTGAWMMVKRDLFEQVGGFDEEHLGVACNDVDFCLRLMEMGRYNVFTPYAEAYHRESSSRGYEDTPEKAARFARERAYFRRRHRAVLERGDPFYNPNLSLESEGFEIRVS